MRDVRKVRSEPGPELAGEEVVGVLERVPFTYGGGILGRGEDGWGDEEGGFHVEDEAVEGGPYVGGAHFSAKEDIVV